MYTCLPYLLAPNILLIAARGIFYKLKSFLVSANPSQIDSHSFWNKEANFQHHLLALHNSEPPGPCTRPGGTSWTRNSHPSILVLLSHCSPSGILFPPSLFTCWALPKFQNFSWNFAFLRRFSRSQKS